MTSIPGGPTRLDDLLGAGPNFYDQNAAFAPKPDTVLGQTGNDTIISATLGGSQIEGNTDNDILTSRGPDDTMFGGQGNDSLVVENISRAIGDEGRDTLTASATATLYGGAGEDFVLGISANNLLFGNKDDDIILGGSQGGDSIYGGKGNDLIGFSTAGGGSNLEGVNIGSEVAGVNEGGNFLAGNLGEDSIVGTGDGDSIYGGQDNDSVVGVGSNVFLGGDLGDDIVVMRNRQETQTLIGGVQSQVVTVGVTNTSLEGGDGNDSIVGGIGLFGQGNNFFSGGAGSDTITSFAVEDSISGGDGDDSLMTMTSDILTAQGVSSSLPGFAGESTLDGGEGNDTITAAFESDVMLGGGGDDLMSGLFTLMDGGDGNDTLDGTAFVRTATTSLEVSLIGGAGDDFIRGASQAATASGLVNFFDPGAGNDDILLTSTSDILVSESAALEGDDTISAAGLPEQTADGFTFTLLDTLGNNVLIGSLNDDSIRSGSGNDFLSGGTQIDITAGTEGALPFIGKGDDTLDAGRGDDFLFGGTGSDVMRAEAGDDTLQGSFDGDTLVGGAGNDTIFYQFADEVLSFPVAAASNADFIDGYEDGADKIVFSRSGFGFVGAGSELTDDQFVLIADRTQRYIASGTAASGRINTPLLAYERGTGFLLYDPDGNGASAASVVARLPQLGDNTFPELRENDIIVI